MEREMNFFDLCVAGWHAAGRGCKACGRLLAHMTRLTFRYWWIVLTLVVLALAAALYTTREDNATYKVHAVAFLNGPTVQQFERVYMPIMSGIINPNDPLFAFIEKEQVYAFASYRVVDGLGDGTADYIDFKGKSVSTDTIQVQMQDRLCLEFRMKARNLHLLPQVEQDLLAYLNANDAMQQSYGIYLKNLQEEAAFNHRQAQKLDSLTSHYYFRGHLGSDSFEKMQQGTVVMSDWGGDWKVRLFLDKIYEQQQHLQQCDYRLQLATAPVTLENHFSVFPEPVNGRLKYLVLFFLFGWIAGCVLAELIDRRKEISAWLKQ